MRLGGITLSAPGSTPAFNATNCGQPVTTGPLAGMAIEECKPVEEREPGEHAGLEVTLMVVSSLIALAGIGLATYLWLKHKEIPARLAAQYPGVHRLLLNKYYVDEVYDATIIQPIKVVSTEGLWRGFDVKVVDGAVNGAGYFVSGVSVVLRLLQNGSVKTYAASMFVGAVAVLGLLLVEIANNVPGLLTLAITLPIIGAVLLMLVPNRDGSKDGLVRYLALGVSLVTFAITLVLWAGFDAAQRRAVPVRRTRAVDRHLQGRVLRRHRRPQPDAAGADRLPDADCAAVGVGKHREEGQGILDLHAAARGVDDRRLLRPRHLPVLRVLGLRPDSDVLPDRHLGLRPAHLRRGEVHPLHHGGKRADARRDHRPGVDAPDRDRRLQLRPAEALRPADSRRHAVLAVSRLHDRVHHQGAAVPVPHLAARCARAGADARLGDPGRRDAEDGRLRIDPAGLPAVPGSGVVVCAAAGDALGDRHRLRRARRDGAAGHEEAGRVFVGEPHGLRRPRHRRVQHAGRAGRVLPDAGARRQHGRAVLPRRHAVGSPAHPPDQRVRRLEEPDAALHGGGADHYALVDRPARHERLHR